MVSSFTLQNDDTIISSGDQLGQIQWAASAESDTGAARLISAKIYAQGEGAFNSTSNPTSIIFATAGADILPASGRIKITDQGHVLPMEDNAYDLGSPDFRFRDLYVTSEVTSPSGNFDYIFFDTTIGDEDLVQGQMNWNSEAGTVELGLTNDVKIQLGQTVLFRVKNSTGSSLSKGQAVYASGVLGGGQIILAAPFIADGGIDEFRFIGLMTDDLANGADGYVNHFGHIKNVDLRTSNTALNPNGETWAVGDILYVDDGVAGGLTKNPPQNDIYVALVLADGQNGELFVRITDPGHITDLHDVNLSGLVDNNLMVWNSGANYWEPASSLYYVDGNVGIGIAAPSGALHVVGEAYVDNLKLDGNTLSSTDSNGNIYITPNGTGGNAAGVSSSLGGNNSTIGGGCNNSTSCHCATIGGGCGNIVSGFIGTVGGGKYNRSTQSYGTVSGGYCNTASAWASSVLGGYRNSASGCRSVIAGGTQNASNGHCSFVGGGANNNANATFSNVVGGSTNCATGYATFVGGGSVNCATAYASVVVGGQYNYSCGNNSFIGAGHTNLVQNGSACDGIVSGCGNVTAGSYSFIGAGSDNRATATRSAVVGGYANEARATCSFVGGGANNVSCGIYAGIVAGSGNNICTGGSYSFIGGGRQNTASGACSTVAGGKLNTSSAQYGFIGGGDNNQVYGADSLVVGGSANVACNTFTAIVGGANNSACYGSFIGGGYGNTSSSWYATIGGGCSNTASASYSIVAGGRQNIASGACSTVSGGYSNTASGQRSTIGGGRTNTASNVDSVVGGGQSNCAAGVSSTIAGGLINTVNGNYSTIAGGWCNCVTGNRASILGGNNNTVSGVYSAILGGQSNNDGGNAAVFILGTGITATSANTTYTQKLNVSHTIEPSGTLFNVEGSNGSLFSVVDNLSGVLMSVNNNAGLPVFEVYDDDSIIAGRFAQNDFVISSGGDVGIGTATPSYTLDVTGSGRFTSSLNVGSNIYLDSNDAYIFGSNNSNNIRFYDTADLIIFSTVTGGAARFDTDIILQKSPSSPIYGPSKSFTFVDYFSSTYDGYSQVIRTYQPIVLESAAPIISRADIEMRIDSNNDSTTNKFFITKDAGTEIFRIQENGNVGIGTTSPSYKLHVAGDISANANNIYGGGFAIYGDANNKLTKSGNDFTLSAGQTTTDIHLGYYNGGTLNKVVTVDSSEDRVGILNTAPAYTLDVTGSGRFTSDLYAGGNLGVGTTSPSSELHVMGGGRFQGTSTNTTWTSASPNIAIKQSNNAPYISWHNDAGDRIGYLQMNSAGTNALVVQAAQPLLFRTNNQDRLFIAAAGNVGIGTTNPQYKLDVNGDSNLGGDVIVGGNLTVNGTTISTNVDTIEIQDPIITLGLTSGNIVTNDSYDRGVAMVTNDGTAFMGWDNSADKFVMLASGVATNGSGNYDAGTWGQLDTGANVIHQATNGDTNGGLVIKSASDAFTHKLYATSAGYHLQLDTNGSFDVNVPNAASRYFYVSSDGNKSWQIGRDGIRNLTAGTNSGAGIYSRYDGYLGFNGLGTTVDHNAISLHQRTGHYDWGLALHYHGSGIGVPHTKGLVLDNRGRVGINDETPSYQLDVNGTAQILPTSSSPAIIVGRVGGSASIRSTTNTALILDSNGEPTYINHYVNEDIVMANGGGNVGIKTVSPTSDLQIGDITSYATDRKLIITGYNAATIEFNGHGNWSQQQLIGGFSSLTYVNTGTQRNTSGSYFNIGNNTYPKSNLRIWNNDDTQTIRLGSNSAYPIAYIGTKNDTTNYQGGLVFTTRESTSVTNQVYIDKYGQLGLGNGTNALSAKLDVRGSAVFNEGGADYDFRVEGSGAPNALFVDGANGNVGIGTATPLYKLDVVGTGNFSDELKVSTIFMQRWPIVSTVDVIGTTNYQLDIYTGSSGGYNGRLLSLTAGSMSIRDDRKLTFGGTSAYLQNTAASSGSDLKIHATGQITLEGSNVGINNTNPTTELDVSGVITANGGNSNEWNEAYDWVQNSGLDGTGSANHVAFWSDANTLSYDNGQLYWDSTNNRLGIGTTSPSTKLEVFSAGYFSVDPAASPLVYIKNNTATNSTAGTAELLFKQALNSTGGKIVSGRDGLYVDGASRDSNLQFYTSTNAVDTEKMRITSDGNVGIGTFSPDAKLEISSIAAASGDARYELLITEDNTASPGRGGGLAFSRQGVIYGGIKTLQNTSSDSNTSMYFQTRGAGVVSNRMTIDEVGNVGIGTTSPSASDSNAKTLQVGNNLIIQNVVGTQTLFSHNAFYDGSWKRATTDDAGAIRFGHLAGGISFHLAPSAAAGSTITNWDNSDVKMVITSAGNVGIGTASPSTQLDVVGSGNFSGDVTITGHLSAATKSFLIDHPTREGHKLQYGSLESPYHGVRLTGRARVENGWCVVKLPEYISELVRNDNNINIQITNIKHGKVLYVDDTNIANNEFTVKTDSWFNRSGLEFFWTFTAVRKDVQELQVEF